MIKIINFLLRVLNRHNKPHHPNINSIIEAGSYSYGWEAIKVYNWSSVGKVVIGKYCSIGSNVEIILGGHNFNWITTFPLALNSKMEPVSGDSPGHPVYYGPVVIGNDVWIGNGVSIIGGVNIGDGAVIAAHSHIIKDVKPYSIVGGNPARLIGMRFTEEIVEKLLKIEWWNWKTKDVANFSSILCSNLDKSKLELMENIHE